MSRKGHQAPMIPQTKKSALPKAPNVVPSLLDSMQEGNEYQSIVSLVPADGEIMPDLKRAVKNIEDIRKHPCICYVSNIVNSEVDQKEIDFSDDLPFKEMITIAPAHKEIDVLLVTPGGITQQVPQFVNALRSKYESVNFIIPYMCMSAGTLFVLSGDSIWMDQRSFIGPIDPQVRAKNGEWLPAQSILKILEIIRDEGNQNLKNGGQVPWHYVRLLDDMDHRQVGNAFTSSEYVVKMASEFLYNYKFKNWTTHIKSGTPVTDDEKKARSEKIASLLGKNDHWKSHSHGIDRKTAKEVLELQIEDIEAVPGLEKAVRQLWALFYYLLERSNIRKTFISSNYALIRSKPNGGSK